MIDTLRTYAEKAKDWLTVEQEDEVLEYDYGFIATFNYEHITTFNAGTDMPENKAIARCDMCGKYFWDMELCIEHVADHNDHIGEEIDPFQPTTEADSWEV
jgi:hypothetical protein